MLQVQSAASFLFLNLYPFHFFGVKPARHTDMAPHGRSEPTMTKRLLRDFAQVVETVLVGSTPTMPTLFNVVFHFVE
jgi:hypothetical protein